MYVCVIMVYYEGANKSGQLCGGVGDWVWGECSTVWGQLWGPSLGGVCGAE